jgi:hypothetical protein
MALLVLMALSPQTRFSASGYVRLRDGKRLAHVSVRIGNVGTTVSTDSGEFAIPLPDDFQPGDPILISVDNYIVMQPFVGSRGKLFLPKSAKEQIEVVVSKRGDPSLLDDPQIERIVEETVSRLSATTTHGDSGDGFLYETAAEIGFSVTELKMAISQWSKSVQGRIKKG